MKEKTTQVIHQPQMESLSINKQFGKRYHIIEMIGQGGMGTVYKALDLELDEIVALKLLNPEFKSNSVAIQRFKRELQLARKINHENVIRIHDIGDLEGKKYLSMAYIEGHTLQQIIKKKGKLALKEIMVITRQICAGLLAAHKQGVVHRDLKPQNIMINTQGQVYVLDFGISQSIDTGRLTGTGLLLGTPDYISPEQIQGRPLDKRTDIYSLGVIIYEMVCGIPPFKGSSPENLFYQHLQQKPPPIRKIRPGMPPGLEKLIYACLKKQPSQRYQDVAQILNELNQIRTTANINSQDQCAGTKKMGRAGTQPSKKNQRSFYLTLSMTLLVGILLIFLIIMATSPANHKSSTSVTDKGQSHQFKSITSPKNTRIAYPSEIKTSKASPAIDFSQQACNRLGEWIINRFHPFSIHISTHKRGQTSDSITCKSHYRGKWIKDYQHQITWKILFNPGGKIIDFKILKDTSPFNQQNLQRAVELLEEFVDSFLKK